MRKHSSYSENKIFPAAKLEDLRTDLIVNKEAGKYHSTDHYWQQMTDMALLKTSALYQKIL
ncbi:hypothetical protein ATZ36_07925 [Candidatus Endomicrobiellum trichonymphae]|uniref:Uncharacterized protein n=1 Tax=Endomicrobium trichonymphae TaxID=1408204 RepID=A0A1E5IH35_ENDTX|nr:hypothetical protein ATZ36_07925 [Candidatus Endomicrobium trichonymphae]